MPEFAGLPAWAWGLIAVVAVALIVGGVFLGRYLWERAQRKYLVRLIGRQENVASSRRTVEAVMGRLVDGTDEELMEFAENPEHVDRKALGEVIGRMHLVRDELDTTALPESLISTAQQLADAAHVIAEDAGRVREGMVPDEVLEALTEIDLQRIATEADAADEAMERACAAHGIEDRAVYGGGLYI